MLLECNLGLVCAPVPVLALDMLLQKMRCRKCLWAVGTAADRRGRRKSGGHNRRAVLYGEIAFVFFAKSLLVRCDQLCFAFVVFFQMQNLLVPVVRAVESLLIFLRQIEV